MNCHNLRTEKESHGKYYVLKIWNYIYIFPKTLKCAFMHAYMCVVFFLFSLREKKLISLKFFSFFVFALFFAILVIIQKNNTMSSQKGNVNRCRPQKHKNIKSFKNDMHDTSHTTKKINSLEFYGLCVRCKDIIEWKVKYKKYKPLTMPKKW